MKHFTAHFAAALALGLAAPAAAAPASAWPAPAPAAPDYAKSASWLCLPGGKDICSRPLATTALEPNSYRPLAPSTVAKDPPLDCFFVYPTVSRDDGDNSDLAVQDGEELFVVQSQFARFAGTCRPFVPLYRQMTVGAIAGLALGDNVDAAARIAFGDVRAAWRHYLASHNRGRPFVLVGHSQGSAMLLELLAHEIEGKPVASQLALAVLPGFNLLVPEGKLVGGSLKSTPLCSQPGERGCVISYTSYRENNPPPQGAMFGFSAKPGMTVGCVNPARPGSRGWEPLSGYWPASAAYPVPGGDIVWLQGARAAAPWLKVDGLVSARCINNGPSGYLALRINADPKDKRTDRIGGEVGIMGFFLPGWGMHLADINAAQGDLLRMVTALAPAPEPIAAEPAMP